ncbi:AMIN-like domain-containing (lipo)protein [Streptomyces sp. NPDC002845]
MPGTPAWPPGPVRHRPTVDVEGCRTFRDTRFAGSLGHTYMGLGVPAQLPFRTFSLPGRIVLDVAHAW